MISMPLGREWSIQHLYNWLVGTRCQSGRFKQQMLRGKVRATREVLEACEFLVPKILRSMKLGSLPEANSEFSPENCWLEDEISILGQKTYFRGMELDRIFKDHWHRDTRRSWMWIFLRIWPKVDPSFSVIWLAVVVVGRCGKCLPKEVLNPSWKDSTNDRVSNLSFIKFAKDCWLSCVNM